MVSEKERIHIEERPVIEFPALLLIVGILMAFIFGLTFLFLPWYIVLVIFFGFVIMLGIVLNPFVGIPLFIFGAYFSPLGYVPELVKLQLPVVAAFGILLAWCFHIMIYRDFKLPQTKQLLFALLFLIILFFSSLMQWYDCKVSFLEVLKVIVLYFLTANLVKTRRQLFVVLFLLIFLGVIVAFNGMFKYIRGEGSALSYEITRAMSFEGNPNYLAVNLVLLIPLLIGLFSIQRSVRLRILYSSIVILFIAMIIFTFSRSGLLSLSVAVSLTFLSFVFKRAKMLAVISLGLIVLVIIPFLPPEYIERAGTITDLKEVSIRGRIDGLIVGFWMMKDHPFLGVGIGRWGAEYWPRAITLPTILHKFSFYPHNLLIEIGAQVGLIALTMFCCLYYFCFRDLRAAYHKFKEEENELMSTICRALEIGLLSFIVFALFASAIYLKILWLLLGLSVVMKRIAFEK